MSHKRPDLPELPGDAMRRAMKARREAGHANEAGEAAQAAQKPKAVKLPPPTLPKRPLPPPLPVNMPAPGSRPKPPPLPPRLKRATPPPTLAATERLKNNRAAELLNQEELERFKSLIVFAKTAVESRFQGRHKSPDLGGGGEFTEFQSYEPGQPIQDIDWQVFARTKKLVIRRYRQQTDMDVHLLVDSSRSMAYQSDDHEMKGYRAARIAAALAYLMIRQGDKASATLFTDKIIDHIKPGGTQRHLLSILRALIHPAHDSDGGTDIPNAMAECERMIRRRGRLVVISDFLGHSAKEVFDSMAPFVHRGCEILLMQICDPAETTLPDAHLARFIDMETGESLEVEPADIREEYEKRVKDKAKELATLGAQHRIDFTSVSTSNPYRDAIDSYLGFRSRPQ